MTSLPPGALSDSATRVVLAICDGERTVRDIAKRVGLSRSTVHEHLVRLRAKGLVDWAEDRRATIHPLVAEVLPRPERVVL